MAAQLKLELAKPPRRFGGRQVGAGRPQVNARKSEPHREREPLDMRHPVHVTIRAAQAVHSLRRHRGYRAFHRALRVVAARADFRVVHLSIQRTHVHLLVEADHAAALARGMQALQISAARLINAEIGRRGNVFVDRYHPVVLDSPRRTRHALAYVLNNWRRHSEHRRAPSTWRLDPFSSAIRFDGWRGAPAWEIPRNYKPLLVCSAQTWLLSRGWLRGGPPIALDFVPGPARA
jgi:REP element-mobilizing transposase RayT